MSPNQKISRLQPLLEQAAGLYTSSRYDALFILWRERLISTTKLVFGEDSQQARRIAELKFALLRPSKSAGQPYTVSHMLKDITKFKQGLDLATGLLESYIDDLRFEQEEKPVEAIMPPAPTLAHLHPTVQQAAGTLFATGHYRQALLDTCIAIDNAVQHKSQLTGSGTRLMETAFSPGNRVLKIGDSADEQQGFLSLFRGLMLAVRNPKAHSLGGTNDQQRALEWLSFASILMRNLDEAELVTPPAS